MRPRAQRANLLLDKLHKGFVCTCIAVTLYGCSVLAYRGFRYYTQIKPELQQKEKERLLAEGSSDNLKDIATTITS